MTYSQVNKNTAITKKVTQSEKSNSLTVAISKESAKREEDRKRKLEKKKYEKKGKIQM